jgi:hypothetical protein
MRYPSAQGNDCRSRRLTAASRSSAVIPQNHVDQKFYAVLIPAYTKLRRGRMAVTKRSLRKDLSGLISWTLQQSQHHDCETDELGVLFETLTSLAHSDAPEFDEQLRSLGAIFYSTFDSELLLAATEFCLVDDLNDIAIRGPVSRPGREHRRPADGRHTCTRRIERAERALEEARAAARSSIRSRPNSTPPARRSRR